MTFEEELIQDWYWYCQKSIGKILPINYIEYTEEEGEIMMGYMVEDNERPLKVDDKFVRILGVTIQLDDVDDAVKH